MALAVSDRNRLLLLALAMSLIGGTIYYFESQKTNIPRGSGDDSSIAISGERDISEKEKEIIDFLKKQFMVNWVVSIEGYYQIGTLILTKSITELNKLWKELLGSFLRAPLIE